MSDVLHLFLKSPVLLLLCAHFGDENVDFLAHLGDQFGVSFLAFFFCGDETLTGGLDVGLEFLALEDDVLFAGQTLFSDLFPELFEAVGDVS